jgi:A/G-specific adenine glycosylase
LTFADKLIAWYRVYARDLPWRRTRDPYRIWISEVMLQQTRVAAAIPYYDRFLARFPTVEHLAAAQEEEVLAAWSGLGYYSRARNLLRAARQVVEAGGFPDTHDGLRALSGIGDYTASAIASIAFGHPHAVLDGNVARVLARLRCEEGDVKSQGVRRRLGAVAQELMDPARPGDFNQAMMELGATVCVPGVPECGGCPVASHCQAREHGRETELPVLSRDSRLVRIEEVLFVIERRGKILMWQRPPGDPKMAGFWELPREPQVPGVRRVRDLGRFSHSITFHRYQFHVAVGSVKGTPRGLAWIDRASLGSLPVSTVARKALDRLDRQWN